MSIKVTVEGLDELRNSLTAYVSGKRQEIIDQTNKSLINIRREAVRRAPVGTPESTGIEGYTGGGLRSGIHILQAGLGGEVISNAEYSPYVEFGTGALVKIPTGLESYAEQFKGAGVRQVNLPARPFMFPSFEEERPKYVKAIEKIL